MVAPPPSCRNVARRAGRRREFLLARAGAVPPDSGFTGWSREDEADAFVTEIVITSGPGPQR
jgi:hypothetical protein